MSAFNKVNVSVVVVEKTGLLKNLSIKDFKEDELYKKCGFKNINSFGKQVTWPIKLDSTNYVVSVYAKTEGKSNTDNKYDFPPPIDSKLFFGNCLIVGVVNSEYISLSLELWERMYEKLFGGFESLEVVVEDENEEDEMDNIAEEFKTKDGYLKDGFIVDGSGSEDESNYDTDEDEDFTENTSENDDVIDGVLEDIGSELSEDEYSI